MTTTYIQPDPSPHWFSVFGSAVRTATSAVQINTDAIDCDGLTLVVNQTVAGGTSPSVTFKVQGVDPINGETYELGNSTGLTSGAMTTVTQKVFRIGPNLTDASGLVAQDTVPPVLLVTATHANGTGNLTYSVTAVMDL